MLRPTKILATGPRFATRFDTTHGHVEIRQHPPLFFFRAAALSPSLSLFSLLFLLSKKKCQVEKSADLMEQTKRKSSAVAAQAGSVTKAAKGIAESAKRQVEALKEANDMVPAVEAGVDEALAALR